jgi:ABC-type antimicrobial peptide transport system permease subunit
LQNISPADEVLLSKQLGLEQSYLQQYLLFLQRLLDGQWALSFSSQQNVLTEMLLVMPATLELAAYALFLSLCIGIPLGIIAAVRKDKWLDKLISSLALIGFSVPIFWWALLLIMVFSLSLGWLPTSGRLSVLYEIKPDTGFMLLDILLADVSYRQQAMLDALRHMLLPSIVLATYPTTVMIRFTRDSMLDVLEQNYIKTARAKGLTRLQVLYTHGLRNALLPVTRQVGLQFSTLITLAMITEVIFSWPGIGRWLIDSIYQRNFPAIQGGVLLVSSLVILVNMLTEILHTLFNPLARKF